MCGEAWPWKWREVQAGRGQVAAPGSGVGEDVGGGQEIRFPGSTLLGVSAQDLWLSPSPLELPLTQGPPCVGVCGPEIQPQNQPVRRGGNSGLKAGREGQRTLCPQPVSSLDSLGTSCGKGVELGTSTHGSPGLRILRVKESRN